MDTLSNLSPQSHQDNEDDWYESVVASRIVLSKSYVILYVVLICLQTFLLTWGLANHGFGDDSEREDIWYIILDTFVTLLLVLEVGVRIKANRRTFWQSWLNWVDVIVCGVCVLTLLMYAIDPWQAEEYLTYIILIVRYSFQLFRLALVIARHRNREHMMYTANTSGVDFTSVSDQDIHLDRGQEGIELGMLGDSFEDHDRSHSVSS